MPVLNEAGVIRQRLEQLKRLPGPIEIIVSDGGSRDATPELAAPHCHRLVAAPRGRARQMNSGAAAAQGETLLFLHADTLFAAPHLIALTEVLAHERVQWGRFDVRLSGGSLSFRVIEHLINWRSHYSGVPTGDQAIFVRRHLFEAHGGYPDIELMEDVALSKRLRAESWPYRVKAPPVVTSSRRWERYGVVRTVALMWALRAAYFLGVPPRRLRHFYEDRAPEDHGG